MKSCFRLCLALAGLLGLACCQTHPAAAVPRPAYTYVLVHGAWGGGWDWKPVAQRLTADGHTVYRATLTGQGERVHLASTNVDLDTQIQDNYVRARNYGWAVEIMPGDHNVQHSHIPDLVRRLEKAP